ncbi:toxic anion resistance protein [Specibacter cremeus]|uniref:toxic anion resistance protein n=1 Tax=Specibacter cremeus TaxID=1629051 RepID=UPI000F773853|nr:toxic anion resistance protein [Specibacter cremeus]
MITPLTPPDPIEPRLELHAQDAPEPVAPVDAPGMVPVPPERQAELDAQARAYVAEVAALDPRDPAFTAKIEAISQIAGREIGESANVSNRLLQRTTAAPAKAKGNGQSAQEQVAHVLGDLRSTVESLTPSDANLGLGKKLFGFMPGGNKLAKYFQKYESAQGQLDAIIKALLAGQGRLMEDNTSLAEEKGRLWDTMAKLSEYATLTQALDTACGEKVDAARAAGDADGAQALEADVLFPIRQRHQDILTQLAVSVQGYLAMDLIRKNNLELVKGVDRARTSTVSALRTAVITAQALADQKMVLDQIDAVNATTNAMILKTSEMLKEQTTRIHQQSASSGVSVETLKKAFDNVFATMDEIDKFRATAARNMEGTVAALEQGISSARPYIERTRQQPEA